MGKKIDLTRGNRCAAGSAQSVIKFFFFYFSVFTNDLQTVKSLCSILLSYRSVWARKSLSFRILFLRRIYYEVEFLVHVITGVVAGKGIA